MFRSRRQICALLVAAAVTSAPAAAESAEPGRLRRFLADHGGRLFLSFGVHQAGRIYRRSVGPSTDPLVLDDPPGIDGTARDRLARERSGGGFLESNGLDVLRYGIPVALIVMDRRDRDLMLRDTLGFLETHWTTGGVTSLLKDAIGRERPALEFADPDDLSPEDYEEIVGKSNNRRSFPSGHASASFAYAAYLDRAIARRVGMRGPRRAVGFAALYGIAGYISYTRLRDDAHYLTDVVAGAAIGVTMARTFYRLNHREEFPATRAGGGAVRIRLLPPQPVPGGAAIMIAVGLSSP